MTITAPSQPVNQFTDLAVTSLFSVAPSIASSITKYQIDDATPGGGSYYINGVQQPAQQNLTLTASQLAQATFDTGSGTSDVLYVRVSDGTNWSSWQQITVTSKADIAPTVSVSNQTIGPDTSLSISSLLTTTSDPTSNGIVLYQIDDATPGGSYYINGVQQPAQQNLTLTASQLAQTVFKTGFDTSDSLYVRVSDGTDWSSWTQFQVSAPAVTITAPSQPVNQFTDLAVTSLFSVAPSIASSITKYQIDDATPGGGSYYINGVQQPAQQNLTLTASQLAQATFDTGSGTSDVLYVRVSDGTNWSSWQQITVTSKADIAPTVSVSNQTIGPDTSLSISSLLTTTSDPTSNGIVLYQIDDATPGGGSYYINGVQQPAQQNLTLTASQLAQTVFKTGFDTSGSLYVRVSDGTDWSSWTQFQVSSAVTITAPSQPVNQFHGSRGYVAVALRRRLPLRSRSSNT